MISQEQIADLHAAFDEMLGATNVNALGRYIAPLDVNAPNQHNSKRDFLIEMRAVEAAIKHVDGLFAALIGKKPLREGADEILQDLGDRIDTFARAEKINTDEPTTLELVRTNARMVGLRNASLWIIIDLRDALAVRRQELKDQEAEFWTVNSRPPNYYARTIALRAARKYARAKGEYPTLGTSRDSGEPSTVFGRGLKEVFRILDISAGIKGPAEWAISQLTEDDIKPPQGLLANALRLDPAMPPTVNALDYDFGGLRSARKGSND